jgi:hypothetical protein
VRDADEVSHVFIDQGGECRNMGRREISLYSLSCRKDGPCKGMAVRTYVDLFGSIGHYEVFGLIYLSRLWSVSHLYVWDRSSRAVRATLLNDAAGENSLVCEEGI